MTGPKGSYTKIQEGLYEAADGSMIIHMGDVLLAIGLEDTVENRELGWHVFKDMGLATPGTMIRTPDDPTWYRVGEIDG